MVRLKSGLVHKALEGQILCGDAFGVFDQGDFVLVVVADGLGHGPEAHAASTKAISVVSENLHKSVVALLKECHAALRPTRGAVMGIARIDRTHQKMTYAGVGNIETRVIGADIIRRPVSINGIIGYNAQKFNSEVFPFLPGDMLLMHSDGIADGFQLTVGARSQEPQTLAAEIATSHGRANDDQLLLIVTDAS